MNREFIINVAFLLSINLLIKPFYIFGIDRTVQNVVGAETYGLYFVLFNFTFLFQIINDFGIQNFNNRNIAQYRHLLDKYFPNILLLKLLLALVYFSVVLLLSYTAGYLQAYSHLLLLVAFNHVLISLNFYVRSNVSGLGRYRIDSLLSAMDKLLMILFCSLLLWGPLGREQFRIEYFIYAQSLSFLLTIALGLFIVGRHIRVFRFRFKPAFLLLILKESYPYALVVFLMTVYSKIDGVMIEKLLPDGQLEAGIYASAYRLLDASNMIGFLFAGLLLPMFARMLKQGESVNDLLQFSVRMIWAAAIGLAFTTYFFQAEVVDLLYTEATAYWGEVLGWLIFSFVAVSGIYVYGALLTANGSLMKMNVIFVVSILLNVLLNAWLIPQYKAAGAAMATIATQFFSLLAQILLAHRELRLPADWDLLWRLLGFTFFAYCLTYGMYNYGTLGWKVNFVLNLSFCALLAFGLKLIDLKAFFATFARSK
ncbi:MAG: oligosaccharide flippase family protein [Bacteroidota bacterium]